MATSNSTQTLAASGLAPFPLGLSNLPELEKISCSIKGISFIHPLQLMGKRIRNAQILDFCNDGDDSPVPESSITVSTVLAVHLGSISHGIETTLLLQDADGTDPYYADISSLTVLDILASRVG